jgi:hypothetical protein
VVQPEIGFYQFATCVDKALDQCFAINESTTICPKVSGELFFFAAALSHCEVRWRARACQPVALAHRASAHAAAASGRRPRGRTLAQTRGQLSWLG